MSARGRAVLSGLAVVVLFCLPLLPEVLGKRRLVFRDAHITHWPWRRVAMRSLSAGEVPFVNEFASGGQPLLANPNAVLLYPTLLLEELLPAASAFNLHYLLHVFWAFFGARALASRLGQREGAAFFSGVAYAFSGMALSYCSAFANAGPAAAWLPWCAAAALDVARARGARALVRGAAAAGIAFGLQLLAGEPVISLLTVLFCGALGLADVFSGRERAAGGLAALAEGGAAAAVIACALAAPLLLPLQDVLPLTYRGQHAYSLKAFGASAFGLWRLPEWLFPRFDGDPGALGAGGHWQWALHPDEIVYVWCVTLGVIPLLVTARAALRRDFWTGPRAWLAAFGGVSLLFAFGNALPFFRALYEIEALRRLRYPIKFYLLTTLCAALLAGFAADRLSERPGGRRERAALGAVFALLAAAVLISGEGGLLDRLVAPSLLVLTLPAALLLPSIRGAVRGDALLGLLALAAVLAATFVRSARRLGYLLGFATLAFAFSWGLPLFVSSDEKDLAREPALVRHLEGPGRLYVDPNIPEFSALTRATSHPEMPLLVSKLARVQVEELLPATGAAFGVRAIFDSDPDGSYGWFNRLAGEALSASTPSEKSRLLRVFGARWVLGDEAAAYPEFRPVTGFSVAGRRLALSERRDPLPELRWAGHEIKTASLSGALELLRGEAFRAETDVVLPGTPGSALSADAPAARVALLEVHADRASAQVEASAEGHLVFSRTYFRSWTATLDGRPAPVLV
ncbi:MAG TPA: hypothetical protein VGS00_01135, partial [Thermoanaerobaculia bacterium]|nr:hypothetical protein [Thermoanaerobaculia bacterium]